MNTNRDYVEEYPRCKNCEAWKNGTTHPLYDCTPQWYAKKAGNDSQGLVIDERTGENIAVTYKAENAPFIVTACNSHSAMLNALELLTSWYDDDTGDTDKFDDLIDLAKQAIQQARS
jgi:hypothetical protein